MVPIMHVPRLFAMEVEHLSPPSESHDEATSSPAKLRMRSFGRSLSWILDQTTPASPEGKIQNGRNI